MDEEQLSAIIERVSKAAPGPWYFSKYGNNIVDGVSDEIIKGFVNKVDAIFIASAREDVPELVAEVERLKNQIHVYKVTDEFVREQSKKVKHLFPLENVAGYGQLCDLVVVQDKEIKRLHYKLRQTRKRREKI